MSMRAYRIVNFVILGILLYALVFPLLSPVIGKLFPSFEHCYYNHLTGNPCPFCGLTSDMKALLSGNTNSEDANALFQFFLAIYFAEISFRIAILFLARKLTGRVLPAIDIVVHSILVTCVLHTLNTV